MVVYVIAGVIALGIMLIFMGLASSGRGSGINDRLERYTAGKPDAPAATAQSGVGLGEVLAQSVALARLNKIVEQRDFGANLARDIARADLKLKPGEFIGIWIGMVAAVPFVFLILGVVLSPLRSPIALLLGALLGFWLPRFWLGRRRAGRLNAFNRQLPTGLC
jgi:tight adherence protein B